MICPNCHGLVEVRNPTGKCDHLYWPDYLTDEAKQKIGQTELARIQIRLIQNTNEKALAN